MTNFDHLGKCADRTAAMTSMERAHCSLTAAQQQARTENISKPPFNITGFAIAISAAAIVLATAIGMILALISIVETIL